LRIVYIFSLLFTINDLTADRILEFFSPQFPTAVVLATKFPAQLE